ncbi:hypothetical protein [Candidatus Nitrososphaera sp. FF02]|uniref:hypothetical protein n=1 Tax=Candidatus Nitrososphaera sp. FF02 TaxID=3398226 RepID=UPI0039E7A290
MGISVSFFGSVADCDVYVGQQIAEARRMLLSHTKQIEEIRRRHESMPGTEAAGRAAQGIKQAEVAGFKVLMNPTPMYELNILDEAVSFAQDRIDVLERTKKELLPALREGNSRIAVIFDDGIPEAFMFY